MFADAFKQFEENISQKVAAAVNEQHGAFVAAQEERWREFESWAQQHAEAERARFEAAVAQAAQEQRQLLEQAISASSRVEAKIREAAAATSQLEAMRQELLKRQRETLSEVSALLDDAKRAVAAVRPAALPDDGADAPGPALPAGADAAGVAPGSPGRVRRQSHLFAPAAAGAAAPAANVEPVIGDVVREPRRAVSDVDSEIDVNDEDFSSTAGGRQLWGKQMSDMNLLASDPEPRPESHALLRYLKVGSVMLLAVLLFGVIVFPYSTAVCLCTACLWLLYLCGEEQLIRTVERRQSSEGGCSRKMTVVARALRKVQGLRSSRSKEFYMKASLCALSGCELIWLIVCLLSWFRFSLTAVVLTLLALLAALLLKAPFFYRRGGNRRGSEGGCEAVNSIIDEIEKNIHQSGHSLSWWSFGQRESQQRMSKIVNLLVDSEADILNKLIERMSETGLVHDLVTFFQHDAELLNMLGDRAIDGDLSIEARWRLLHTLMSTGISSCKGAEKAVESLLVSVEGDELSELKSKQDSSGDRHSMHKLIFEDIKDEKIQLGLLNHILVQGADQVARRSLNASGHFRELVRVARSRGWRECGADSDELYLRVYAQALAEDPEAPPEELQRSQRGHAWLKIITDIDDTMVCCGGKWPSGIDDRYPRHTPYPGATVFWRELQGGVSGGHIVALSARPHIPTDIMETTVFNRFRKMMHAENGLHAIPSLLTGSMEAGSKYLLSGGVNLKALCDEKYENFKQYLLLYPEFRIVFLGDNGQADYALGQRICREFPHNMLQVWIHEVQPRSKTFKYEKDAGAPIEYFEDYIAAAVSAATLTPYPLISPEGLRRVAIAAVRDFQLIGESKHPWTSEGQRMAEAKRLNQSILRACQVMSFLGLEDLDDVVLIDGERRTAPEESLMAWAKGTMAARMLARRPAALAGCQDAETQTQTAPECQDGGAPLDRGSEAGSSSQARPAEAPSALQKVRQLFPLGLARGADSALPISPRNKDGDPAWDAAATQAAPEEASDLPRTSSTSASERAADAPAEANDAAGDATTRGLLRSFFPGKWSDSGPAGPAPPPEAAGAEGGAPPPAAAGGEAGAPAPPEGPEPAGSSRQSLERQLVETREALDEREAELSELRARLAALEGRQVSAASSEDAVAALAAATEAAALAGDSSRREPSAGASLMENVRRVFSGKTPEGDPRHRRPQSVQGSPKGKWLRSPAASPDSSRPGAGPDPSAFLLPAGSGAEAAEPPAPQTPRRGAPAAADAPRTPAHAAAAQAPPGAGARAPSPPRAAERGGPEEPSPPPLPGGRGGAAPPAAPPAAAAAAEPEGAGAAGEAGAGAGAPPPEGAAEASGPAAPAAPAGAGAAAGPRAARQRASPTRGNRRGAARAEAPAAGQLEPAAEEGREGQEPRGEEAAAATAPAAHGGGVGLPAPSEAPRCRLARGADEFASALSLADQSCSSLSLAEQSCSELHPAGSSPSLCPTEAESPAPGAPAAPPPAAAALEVADGGGGPSGEEPGGEAGPAS